MFDGMWTVNFSVPGDAGHGVVVISGDTLLGGDSGYYYAGKVVFSGSKFQGELEIIQHSAQLTSVFGKLSQFKISITGEIVEGQLTAKANLLGTQAPPMSITGKKVV